jgi:hypothetical protein
VIAGAQTVRAPTSGVRAQESVMCKPTAHLARNVRKREHARLLRALRHDYRVLLRSLCRRLSGKLCA